MGGEFQVAIVGAGALGTALSHYLHRSFAGELQLFWRGRKGWLEQPRQIRDPADNLYTLTPADPKKFRRTDLVFVTTRAYDLRGALDELHEILSPDTSVIVLCNGLHYDLAKEFAERESSDCLVRIGMTTLSCTKTDNEWIITNPKPTFIFGPVGECKIPTERENQFIRQLMFPAFETDVRPALQQKWMFNLVINGLCGKYRLPRNGDLLDHEDEVNQAINEAYKLGEQMGQSWQVPVDDLNLQVWGVIKATINNKNSLVRDLDAGQKTEIDYFTGVVPKSVLADFPTLFSIQNIILGN